MHIAVADFTAEALFAFGCSEGLNRHLRRLVHDVQDTFGGPDCRNNFGIKVTQTGNGSADDARKHRKVEQVPFQHFSFLHHDCRLPNDKKQGTKHHKNDECREEPSHARCFKRNAHHLSKAGTISFDLKIFVGIGFDRLNALHGFFYHHIGFSQLILASPHEFADVAPKKHGRNDHNGHRSQHDQRQFRHGKHNDEHPTQKHDDLADEFSNGQGNNPLYLGNIAGDAAGQLPYPSLFQKRNTQGDQLLVQVPAQSGHTFFTDHGKQLHS